MQNNFVLIITIFILVLLSAFFSATETAYSSINKIRLKKAAKDGNKKAKKALEISENYDKMLSTALVGNNIINIVIATLSTVLFTNLYSDYGPLISTIFASVIVLIVAEVLPKTYAKENSENFSMSVASTLSVFIKLFAPIVVIFVFLKKIFIKKLSSKEHPSVTEEELKHIISDIEVEGVLEQQESELVKSALEFDEIDADEILTPRVDVIAIDVNSSVDFVKNTFISERFSRLPVYEKNIDNIIGILHDKDFFPSYISETDFSIRELIHPAIYIPPQKSINELLTLLQKNKSHMAIVVDQYGGTLGIVTLEDVLEQLVGEIYDEYDVIENDIVVLDDNTFEVAGDINLNFFSEEIGFDMTKLKTSSNTLGGLLLEFFERIPSENEEISISNITVKIKKILKNRIISLIVKRNDPIDNS